MKKASQFKSNRSQAIRLPKSDALTDDVKRGDVVAIGKTRIITPRVSPGMSDLRERR